MTEKEYKKLISEIDITSQTRENLNNLYEKISSFVSSLSTPFSISEIKKSGILQSQMAIDSTNYINILININVASELNINYHNTLIINELLKSIILNTEIKSYEITNNILKIKLDDNVVNLYVLNNLSFEIETKKLKFYEEINQKYTLFKNAYKILRHLLLESNVEFVDDYALSIILIYGLEKYFSSNKYDNYMVAFVNALDDLINTKKIELQENYINVTPKLSLSSKGYTITDPFDESNNLALNINEANIGELRKFKKKIAKMYEQVTPDTGSSSILTLNINPIINNDNTLSWRYDVVGRNIQNSGGAFPNTESDSKNASLKAYFRGLKAIVNSNIYNKNITVITKHKDILKCIEKDSSEAENNSRRKTITKYIEDNKLLISYQIKE